MWGLIAIIVFLVAVFALAIAMDRRMRRRILREMEPTGAKIRSIKSTARRRAEYYVVFESRNGDLRRAIAQVRRGRVEIVEDQPYHFTVKRPAPIKPGSPPSIDIDQLEWAATLNIYPGHEEYKRIALDLATGAHSQTISETDPRFAGILQCLEVHSLANSDEEWGTLDLSINNKPYRLTWRIDGTEPNRNLVITVNPY